MKFNAQINGKNRTLVAKKKSDNSYVIECEGITKSFEVNYLSDNTISLISENRPIEIYFSEEKSIYELNVLNTIYDIELKDYYRSILNVNNGNSSNHGAIKAAMPGKVVKILVKEGDEVKSDSGLIILEAMKMENEMKSPINGVIKKIHVMEGDTIEKNTLLIEIDNNHV